MTTPDQAAASDGAPVAASVASGYSSNGISSRNEADPTRLYGHELAARLRAGETSSREIVVAHLEVAERQNRVLNAWLTIDRDRALGEADAADARLAAARAEGPAAVDALHPLLGIPIALKDLISVEGGQCTAGSRILEGYLAPYDAHITERLRDAGAVILGKTNMDEFAMGSSNEFSAYGPVSNPWDLDTVPGGSSGGSAVAVAAYHAPLALGTDTGGSIRQPAALSGIVGLKPTYGRVSRYGIVAFASSLDQIGPLARDCRDAAALLHAVAGRDARDSTSAPVPVPDELLRLPAGEDEAAAHLKGKRFGLPREYFVAGMERDVERRIRDAVSALEAAGAQVEEVSLPHTDYGLATYYIVAPAEASANLARYDGVRYGRSVRLEGADFIADYLATRGEGFGAEVKRRIMLGTYALSAGYYDAYYVKAQKVRTLIKRDFDEVFGAGIDAIVAPTSPSVAFRFGARLADPVAMYLSDACTLPANMAGIAGLSVPCGLSEGLPVGLQFIGPPWSELELLRLGRAYEAITAGEDWRRLEPAQLALADDPAQRTAPERAAAAAAGIAA